MAELRLSIYIYMSLVLEKKKEEQEKKFTNIRGKFISWGGKYDKFLLHNHKIFCKKDEDT